MLRKYLSLMFLSTRGCCKQEFQKRDTIVQEPHVCCCKTVTIFTRGWFSWWKNISFTFHWSRVSFILNSSFFQAVNTDFFCPFLILFFDLFFFSSPYFFKITLPSLYIYFSHFHPRVPGLTSSTSSALPPVAAALAPAPNPEPTSLSWVTAAGDGGRLSSDEGDAEPMEDNDTPACHYSDHHPQPAGVNIVTTKAATRTESRDFPQTFIQLLNVISINYPMTQLLF